jgi:mRNA-degrading endonuclease RelE of RelBE toxin-antitoxin system
VVLAIEQLAANDPRADVRKITGADEHRLRVGEWRVRFHRDDTEREIIVLRVLPRGRAYDR